MTGSALLGGNEADVAPAVLGAVFDDGAVAFDEGDDLDCANMDF
jgi:hypothetical protein